MSTTVEFDLSPEQVKAILQPASSGWLVKLMLRVAPAMTETVNAKQTGPTGIELSAAGLRVSKAGVTPDIGWADVRQVMERPLAWVFLLKPSGTRIIPRSAVAADQQDAFTAELRALAGKKYRVSTK